MIAHKAPNRIVIVLDCRYTARTQRKNKNEVEAIATDALVMIHAANSAQFTSFARGSIKMGLARNHMHEREREGLTRI